MDSWGTPVTLQELEKLDKHLKKSLDAPRSYIEAKPEREVSMNEFEYVLVPKDKIDSVKNLLKDT
jgi:hypothetical protein